MNTEKDNAKEQAQAQLNSIRAMVAALEVDYDRLEELEDEYNARNADAVRDWPNAGELDELKDTAGECKSYDEAQQRIQEDPLSVQIRSGWYSVGEKPEPVEFEILLCTGGPAVRIRGELGQYNEPDRAWIEYQDWFTPWTEFFADQDTDALLTYCQQFYFGE